MGHNTETFWQTAKHSHTILAWKSKPLSGHDLAEKKKDPQKRERLTQKNKIGFTIKLFRDHPWIQFDFQVTYAFLLLIQAIVAVFPKGIKSLAHTS